MTLPAIERLVPHARPALLLDRIVEARDGALVTETCIREDNPYCDSGRVGAWVGLELIAQSAAALAGLEAVRDGQPVRIGYLLGTRHFRATVPSFALGDRLRIEVAREFRAASGLGAARGRIFAVDGSLLCEGLVTVFQPTDAADPAAR